MGEVIRRSLSQNSHARHLGVGAGTAALVAAEIVATAAGMPREALSDALAHWLPTMDGTLQREELASIIEATERVRDPALSDLAQLWADTEDNEAWRGVVDSLLARLRLALVRLGAER